jgi:hypothetical protein
MDRERTFKGPKGPFGFCSIYLGKGRGKDRPSVDKRDMVDRTNRYSSGGGGQQVLDLRTDKEIWNERMEEGAAFYNRTPLPCCSALRLPGSDPDGAARQGRDGDGDGPSYDEM